MCPPEVTVGPRALDLLHDSAFLADWSELYECCPWGWVAELPAFLVPWYEVYEQYEPVIVHQRDTHGQLVGLLALCWNPEHDRLVGGGYDDAEYLSWLCVPERTRQFMPEALEAVRDAVGPALVELGWFLPDTPLEWVHERIGMGAQSVIEKGQRFLVPVADGDGVDSYVRGKKRLRTKLNKLKRQGELVFRRYKTPEELSFLFDHFFPQMYLRKAAQYGHQPFSVEGEEQKRRLLLRLARTPGLYHASALELDGVPIAAHMGSATRGVLTLAGLGHSPFLGPTSPGQQLLMHLVRNLHDEGFHTFDLSPGPEAYKERLGVEPQTVCRMTVYLSARRYLASRAKSSVKAWIKRVVPASLVDWSDEAVVEEREVPAVFVLREGATSLPAQNTLSPSSLTDLLAFPRDDGERWVLFQRCAERLTSTGGMSLTRVRDGHLVEAWFLVEAKADRSLRSAELPKDGWVLRASMHGPQPADLDASLRDALAAVPEECRAVLYATVDRPELDAALRRAGFEEYRPG